MVLLPQHQRQRLAFEHHPAHLRQHHRTLSLPRSGRHLRVQGFTTLLQRNRPRSGYRDTVVAPQPLQRRRELGKAVAPHHRSQRVLRCRRQPVAHLRLLVGRHLDAPTRREHRLTRLRCDLPLHQRFQQPGDQRPLFRQEGGRRHLRQRRGTLHRTHRRLLLPFHELRFLRPRRRI